MSKNCNITDFGIAQGDLKYVGYGDETLNNIMIIISIVGIIINCFFGFSYAKKIIDSSLKVSIMERILCIIAITETLISVCWLINNYKIKNTEYFGSNCDSCLILAYVETFLYLFDWMILSMSLYQIKKIILNPQQILDSRSQIKKYIIGCFIGAVVSVILEVASGIGGISPMLTCFINIYMAKQWYQKLNFWIFFLIPLGCLIFGFYQFFIIRKSTEYKTEKSQREFFKEYSYFVITYILFSLMLIISYILNYFLVNIGAFESWKIFITIVTLSSCSSPLIVGIIRLYRTELAKRLIYMLKNKISPTNEEKKEFMLPNNEKMEGGRIYRYENKMLVNEVIKHYIAISYCIGKSKFFNNESENNENNEINSNLDEKVDYTVNKQAILKDLDLAINEDIIVLEETNIDIEVTEFNSSVFKELRELEGMTADYLISIFQPKKATSKLIKKINNFLYINSTNKLLMLKQITEADLKFYQKSVLPEIHNYLSNNKNSLIRRVFGLYKMRINKKETEYMALVYNTYESLEDDFFLKAKDDEKIMTLNESSLKQSIVIDSNVAGSDYRKMTLDVTRKNNLDIGNTNNNNEKRFKIFLTKDENEKLLNIISEDLKFIKSLSIYGSKILVCEKNINKQQLGSLVRDSVNEGNEEISKIKDEKDIGNIKKYVFSSNLDGIIYSIAIIDLCKKYY